MKIVLCMFTLKNCFLTIYKVHAKLRSITPVATNVHMILQSFVVLTWMRGTIELV